MQRLTSKQAQIITSFVFLGSVVINYFLPEHAITTAGLLVCIFLTVFIPGRLSTILFFILSTIAILVSGVMSNVEMLSGTSITYNIFRLMLVLFTTFIVFHLKQLYSNIQYGQTHMDSLFENATEGIILTNSKGIIVLVNPAAENMFEYKASELIGQPIEVLIPRNVRGGHVKLREGFHQSPQNRVMGHGRDLHGTKKNGMDFPVEVSLSYYKKNNESFAIAFIVDITERKNIETNLLSQKKELERVSSDIKKMNTQLEGKVEERTLILKEALQRLEQSQIELSEALDKEKELNEIKSRFVSMASHEFRTPLSTVLSSASLLSRYTGGDEQEKRDKHIYRIKDSVKQLNDILEDFLSLGKLDEGKVKATFSEFDITGLIGDTTEEMRDMVKNGQQIRYEHSGDPLVKTDKKLLKNILINLIGNAIKFSPEGSPIEVTSNLSGDRISISIKDHGIGISPEDQEHLFSSFFRAKNAVNVQGTGLGLHIVKRYLDLVGGNVELKSDLNIGTTITLNIPSNINNYSES